MKPYYIQSEYGAIDARTNSPILTHIIKGFPYPSRFCSYCERELEIINAIHYENNEEIYKCIFQCFNTECGSYDEEGNMSYLRVYYSNDLALELFETVFLKIKREIKE